MLVEGSEMELIQNSICEFRVPNHARISLAFRYGIVVNSNRIEAFYRASVKSLDDGREEAKVDIDGVKVDVVLHKDTIVTALPKSKEFKTTNSRLIKQAFEAAHIIDPECLSLEDIVVWRTEYLDSKGTLSLSSLNKYLGQKANEQKNKPTTKQLQVKNLDNQNKTASVAPALLSSVVLERENWISIDDLFFMGIAERFWLSILESNGADDLPSLGLSSSDVQLIKRYLESSGLSEIEKLYKSGASEKLLKSFLVELDPEQKKCLQKVKNDGPYLIKGGAGTGKSLVGIYYILEQYKNRSSESLFDQDLPTYGVITYTNTLVSSNKALFDNLNGVDTGSDVSHSTLDKIAYSLLSKKTGGKLNLISTEGVSNWLVKIAKDSQNSEERLLFEKLGFQYIAEEIEDVVHGNNLTNLQEYKDQDRRGRKIAITQKDRSTIWTIHEALISICKQKRVLTFGMFRCSALAALIEDKDWPRFSALFVDEVQDMSKVSRLLCLNLVKNPKNLLLAADTAQAIYTIPPTWSKTHEIFDFRRRRPLKLEKSYRSTKEISEAIQPLVIDPGDEDDRSSFPKPTRSGPKPLWIDAALQDHVKVSCELIKKIVLDREGVTNFGQIAIIVREGARANEHVNYLEQNGIKATVVSKYNPINLEDDKVHIVTAHSSKGLSFPIVIVPYVANGVYPMAYHMDMAKDPEHKEKILEVEQRLLYVALSRSSAWLYMITDPSNCSPYTSKLNRAECWR